MHRGIRDLTPLETIAAIILLVSLCAAALLIIALLVGVVLFLFSISGWYGVGFVWAVAMIWAATFLAKRGII